MTADIGCVWHFDD